jgi:uncharacterized protein
MVTRDTAWPAGTPCWVDLGAGDTAQAAAFYSGVFGWTVQPGMPEAGNYSMCEVGGQAVAGIGQKMSAEMPTVWTTYLASDDVDATVERVRAAGGQVVMEPMDVMEAGRMAIATDPGGAAFGIWQSGLHTGAGRANEPGSLIWNENMSRDFEANKAFYQAVFGYEYGDMSTGDFRYATLDLDGRPAGGIGELGASVPAEHPAHWSAYFGVQDTDATVAKVTELGGRVIQPAWDSPYGRMAVLADDQGAVFSVMSVASEA